MSGRILQAMMMVLTCYVAGQKPGAVAAETDSSDLENRLERLEAIYERNMQKQNELNSQQADQLQQQAEQLQQQADQLQQQTEVIAEQSDIMAGLKLENQKQARVNAEQGEQICDLEQENQRQRNNFLSFTASATTERAYNPGDRVLFDSVLRNYGDSYDSVFSIFTCSVSGYYLFSLTVRTHYDGAMHAQIQLDDTPLVAAFAYDLDTGSNLVVTSCDTDQAVWVKCHTANDNVMNDESHRYSVFSGTLLTLA